MRILLTGATGYLGSNLAKAFIMDGHCVFALKRKKSCLTRLIDFEKEIQFYDIDDFDIFDLFKKTAPFDAVIHTATCYGRAGETVSEVFKANTEFPLRLLEAMLAHETETFLNTDTILSPYINAYSLSKRQFGDWGRYLSEDEQVRFLNVKLDHMYGPDDDTSKFPSWIVKQCALNESTIRLTSGEQRRDFIYIDDVVDAYRCLLDHSRETRLHFQEVGIGTGSPIRLRDFVETAHRLSHSNSKLVFGSVPYRKHELMGDPIDTDYLKSLGWSPKVDLKSGVLEMLKAVNS